MEQKQVLIEDLPAFLQELRGNRTYQQIADLAVEAGYDGAVPGKPRIDRGVVHRAMNGKGRPGVQRILAQLLSGRKVVDAIVLQ